MPEVVEICAGGGGSALGLEQAGFGHAVAVELDARACATLRLNRPHWDVRHGDVADAAVWRPAEYEGVDLIAGGVPCPPFTLAGLQLGALDERDLLAWTVELTALVRPRALLLENVRGLATPRFGAYRQHVMDRLAQLGYVTEWRVLAAADFGVPQLRPRFILVALRPDDAGYFRWPSPLAEPAPTVGEALYPEMASRGWELADVWAKGADRIAPTLVGGSKKHGGPDLGPSRAKAQWRAMGVDPMGIASEPPARHDVYDIGPRLTARMAATIQGFDLAWQFAGPKTVQYKQTGNAFPPPLARAVGIAIRSAFAREGVFVERRVEPDRDPVYTVLRGADVPLTAEQIAGRAGGELDVAAVEQRLALIGQDFDLDMADDGEATRFRLGAFRAFVGQAEHGRHEALLRHRARVS